MRERALLVGGDVDVESRPEVGTRVRLRVPIEESDGRRCWPKRLANRTRSMRVLIADDHGIVRSGLRMLLERQRTSR